MPESEPNPANSAKRSCRSHTRYDNEGNKKYEQKLHQPANSEAYSYDSLYRLIDYRVGALAGDTIPSPTNHSTWALDPVGNWNNRVTDGATETRTHNAANEITETVVSNQLSVVSHDANGNVVGVAAAVPTDGRSFEYDEYNRLVRVSDLGSPPSVLAEFAYDALGRRILKRTWPAGMVNETCFAYDGARIIEEQACSAGTPATYTYGNYVDEVLTRDTATQRLYYHQNALWSVAALTDANGNVMERYSYDAYGLPSILAPDFSLQTASAVGNRTMFTGREWDAESTLYHYRARPYSPTLGRFLSRDPLEYVDGMNLYAYVRNAPHTALDPHGLTPKQDHGNCERQRKAIEPRIKDERTTLGKKWRSLRQQQQCEVPPLECICCKDDVRLSPGTCGYWDGAVKKIFICENKLPLSDPTPYTHFSEWLSHELVHAAQSLCYKWDASDCKTSVCKEIQAYTRQFGDLNKETVKRGVMNSSLSPCAREVIKPWDDKKTTDQNIGARREEVDRKLSETFDSVYDSCSKVIGKPENW